ncbi:MAG: acyltransferase, partial [Rhizobiales bacterium]|nr:acyltransferase [Hyphomicrobiales bacterium]
IGDALAYSSLLLGLGLIDVPSIVNPIARYYGLISYSLYLWHLPVIWTLTPFLRSIYERVETPIAFLLSSVVIVAVATGVADVSYRLIERPGEKIGRRLIARLLSRTSAPQSAPSPG